MKKMILSLSISMMLAQSACVRIDQHQEKTGINVLLLMSRNWGLNSYMLRDEFERQGWQMTYSGVLDTVTACPLVHNQGLDPVIPEITASAITDLSPYDCVVIPPGSGDYLTVPDPFGDLIASPDAIRLIRDAGFADIPVFAMCSGVRVLAAADVIRDKKIIGGPKFQDEYESAGALFQGADHPPVIDGNIITAKRGQYYNYHNGQAIATAIENRQPKGMKRSAGRRAIIQGENPLSEDSVAWSKTYGGSGSDGGRALCRSSDGGFLLAGYTFSGSGTDADVLIVKTDAKGGFQWSRIYGGKGTEYANGCAALRDGYLITGYTTSFGAGSKDVWLIKIDADGREIWSKTFGGENRDVGMAVCATSSGDCLICGYTASYGAGEEDVWLIKTDADGNEIWSKTFGGERSEIGNALFVSETGDIFVSASTGTYGNGNCDFYLIRADENGDEIWSKSHGIKGKRGYGFDWCTSMSALAEGGALLTGFTDSGDIMDAVVMKVDSEGNEVWVKSFGKRPFHDYGLGVCEMEDGGILVCGTTKKVPGEASCYDNDIYLVRLDAKGNVVREKTFGSDGSDWGCALEQVGRDVVLVGQTDTDGNGLFKACLMKVEL